MYSNKIETNESPTSTTQNSIFKNKRHILSAFNYVTLYYKKQHINKIIVAVEEEEVAYKVCSGCKVHMCKFI